MAAASAFTGAADAYDGGGGPQTKYGVWHERKLVFSRGLAEDDGVVGRGRSRELGTMSRGNRQDWLYGNVKLSSTLPPTHIVRT
ncbi:hypothetical protein M0802_001730 [Mischocyttarus mexicanus]|nr:hypothetical protein M0802_001730 [Mischocyttarus mexicanus]